MTTEWDPGLLTLTLRPGIEHPLVATSVVPPGDMPPGDITISLPLYPDSIPSTLPFKPPGPPSHTPYIKSAWARVHTSEDWHAVREWYDRRLQQTGWNVREHGEGKQHSRLWLLWLGATHRDDRHLYLRMCFEQDPSGGTEVLYQACRECAPPRDPGSYVRDTIARVAIRYSFPSTGMPPQRRVVRLVIEDPETIRHLVRLVNEPAYVPTGINTGANDRGQGAELTLIQDDGTARAVSIKPSHHGLRIDQYRGLRDEDGRIWKAVSALVQAAYPDAGEYWGIES